MKHTLLTFLAVMALCNLSAQKMGYEQLLEYMAKDAITDPVNQKSPGGDTTIPQTNEPITADMLNCPVGVYRTYEDFLNKKAEPLYFIGVRTKGFLTEVTICFKNKDKKEVILDGSTLWGFKTESGILCRMGTFFYKKQFYIPFEVEYVSDYVLYHSCGRPGTVYFGPLEWCSSDLKSPILDSKYFFAKFPKTRHNAIVPFQNTCLKNASRLGSRWAREITACETTCPDLRFVYVNHPDKDGGEYKAGGMK